VIHSGGADLDDLAHEIKSIVLTLDAIAYSQVLCIPLRRPTVRAKRAVHNQESSLDFHASLLT
jgi:hypothetical protein